MRKIFSVSMMCAPKEKLETVVKFVVAHEGLIHIDIIDEDFSKCEGFEYKKISYIREKFPTAIMDIHIMAMYPEKYVNFCIENRCDIISFHIEGRQNTPVLLRAIKGAGLKAGLAIRPDSKLDILFDYLNEVDLINVMTVHPGPAGQKFQKKELNKVVSLHELRNQKGYVYDIEVDGSCNEEHLHMIENAGTDIFVLGTSGLFALDKNLAKAWERMIEYSSIKLTIYLHADLVGNTLKEHIKSWLDFHKINYIDLYTDGLEEYPECARKLCHYVLENPRNYGILCCGTGIGMSIVANKIPLIRAAVVSDCYSAKMAKEHNNANVLCLGSRVVTNERANLILESFLESKYLYGKHTPRVDRYEII